MDARDMLRAQRMEKSADVLDRLRQILPSVLPDYPVVAAYVYGSAARGTMLPSSDVDIALVCRDALPSYDRLKLELSIQGAVDDFLRSSPVDVRIINGAPLTVRGRIVQAGILVYEGDRAHRVAFEVDTRKRYFDFAPVARRLRDAFLERVHREGLLHG